MEITLLLTAGLLATVVIAWLAFFRVGGLERRVEELSRELRALRPQQAARPASTPSPAAPAAAAGPPAPPQPATPLPFARTEPPPPPPPAPQRPPAGPPEPIQPARSFEEHLTTRWFVWIAGVALVLGGAFLVRQVWGQPWFGPPARVAAALLLGAAMLGVGVLREAKGRLIAAMLVAAGLATLFAGVFAGRALYYLYSSTIAFAGLGAIAAGGALLGLRHGLPISALSIAGAFVVPVLVRGEDANAGVLFAYLFAVTLLGLALTLARSWRMMAALTAIGAIAWPILWLTAHDAPLEPLALYVVVLGLIGATISWRDARLPLALHALAKGPGPSAAHIAGAPLGALASPALFWLALESRLAGWALALAAAGSILSLVAAHRRGGFALWPCLALAAALGCLYFWPPGTDAKVLRPNAFAAAAAATGAIAYAGGLVAMRRTRMPGFFAYLVAAGPVGAMVLAWWRLGDIGALRWAAIGVAIAAALLAAVELVGRRRARPMAQSVLAIGAALAGAAAVAFSLHGATAGLGYATAALIAALVHARWRYSLIALAGGLLAARALLSLVLSLPEVEPLFGASAPLALLTTYGGVAALLCAGALIMRASAVRPDTPANGAYEATALGAAMIGLTLLLRLLIRGSLTASAFDLLEAATYVTAWLSAALALRLTGLASASFVLRWSERLIAAAAVAVFVFGCCFILNPVFGPYARPVEGWPLVNALLLAYAAPGVLAAVYAWKMKRDRHRDAARALTVVSAMAAPLWATFETRRAFRGPELATGIVSNAELWAYSAVWMVSGALLLAAGFMMRRSELRWSALALISLTVGKVFLIDMAGLAGVWRALSFIGLGLSLLALAAIYQRRGAREKRKANR